MRSPFSGAAQEATGGGAQILQRAGSAERFDLVQEIGIVTDHVVQRRTRQRAQRRGANVLVIAVVFDDVLRPLGEFLRVEKIQAGDAQRSEAARLRLVFQQFCKQV